LTGKFHGGSEATTPSPPLGRQQKGKCPGGEQCKGKCKQTEQCKQKQANGGCKQDPSKCPKNVQK